MCVAMYHPAAGLHQASLADIIRDDFRKLPLFMEEAKSSLATRPMMVATEQRVEAAEEARTEVVNEAVTGTVIDAPVAREAVSVAPVVNGTVRPVVLETPAEYASVESVPEAQAEVPQPGEVSAAPAEQPPAKPAPRRSKKKTGPQYKQMSFFDL